MLTYINIKNQPYKKPLLTDTLFSVAALALINSTFNNNSVGRIFSFQSFPMPGVVQLCSLESFSANYYANKTIVLHNTDKQTVH